MPIAMLNKGYNISEGRRTGGNRMKLLRWVFLAFSGFIIFSVCLAIGYISRVNLSSDYKGSAAASRTQRDMTPAPIKEEEINYMYQYLPADGEGMAFDGNSYYDVPSVSDTPIGSIALWFQYPFHSTDKLMFIAGNREIVSKKEDGNGYALYVDAKTNKLHLVWRSKDDKNHDEMITSGKLRENRWNHIVINFSRSKRSGEDGGFATTIEIYINNSLSFLRREVRYPAGVHSFSIGASPRHKNAFKGRIYNVMIAKNVFTENQIATIYENRKRDLVQLHSLCQGIYLLKTEYASSIEKVVEEEEEIEEEEEKGDVVNIAELDVMKNTKTEVKKEEVKEEMKKEEVKEEMKKEEVKDNVKETKEVKEEKSKPKPKSKPKHQSKEEKDEERLERKSKKDKVKKPIILQPDKDEETLKLRPTKPQEVVSVELEQGDLSKLPNPRELLQNYITRPSFTPSKVKHGVLRSEPDTIFRPPPPEEDELCSLIPPAPIPVLSGNLETFVNDLQHANEEDLKFGTFSFTIPEDLHDEYHYLSEYRAKNVRDSFCFGWAGYKQFAWGHDEVHPISGGYGDNWGGFGMTILDSIDSLKILGLNKEFDDATTWVRDNANFDRSHTVSVFETNIRIIGGMISAYDLTHNSLFLDKAVDMANRLLPAFDTPSGYPKSSINLKTGSASVPSWTGNNVLLSELGSMSLEYLYLARHARNPKYQEVIDKMYNTLYKAQKSDGLFPIYLSPITGEANGGSFSMGASADSYYEYLLKMWIQGGKKDEKLRKMYNDAVDGMTKRLFRRSSNGLLYCGEESYGRLKQEMGHLTCFIGGMLALGVLHNVNPATADRDLANAQALGYTCYRMYKESPTGISGEGMMFNSNSLTVNSRATYYILRPEALETLYYLNQVTGDPIFREWGWEMWQAIEKNCRTKYGYGHLRDVRNAQSIDDRAESFFFAETAKYAYLLFKDEKIVDLTKKILNTEAHPLSVFEN